MTFGIQITTNNVDETIAALNRLGAELPDALEGAAQTAFFPVYYAVANYDAPALPTYTRTEAMQNSVYLQVEMSGPEMTVMIGGNEELYWTRGTADGSSRASRASRINVDSGTPLRFHLAPSSPGRYTLVRLPPAITTIIPQ